jgi:hypothetical protein
MSTEAERFAKVIRSWAPQGACDWRLHDDGTICCVMPMIYTWAVVVGVRELDYDYRYCYAELSDAKAAFALFEDHTIHPAGPWIVCKGRPGGQIQGPGSRDVAGQRIPEGGGAAAVDPADFNDSEDI